MDSRSVTKDDLMAVLTNGQILFHEVKKDELWRVRGVDLDGRTVEVVVAVYADTVVVKVITVIEGND
jgi:hypothetical protein